VLEDGVLAFRKLKKGGILIFDDYGWGGEDVTARGINAFLSAYHKRMRRIVNSKGEGTHCSASCQVIVQKNYGKDW